MKLHENIRELRKEKNMTQEQLAEAMGVSTASVSKWETGQSAPELTMLMDLADFFAVSVDMLMGHCVEADRLENRMAEIEALGKKGEYNRCAAEAEKLIRNYPNDVRVLDRCGNMFYNLYMSTSEKDHMERSIELMKRIIALEPDPTGEKLSRLANRYELFGNWEEAERCYKEANVGGVNDRHLARCLANRGQKNEAMERLSEVFIENLFHQLMDILTMVNILQEKGKMAEAEAALQWGCVALEGAGTSIVDCYGGLGAVLCMLWAITAEERGDVQEADSRIYRAVSMLRKGEHGVDFLSPKKFPELMGNAPQNVEMLLQTLRNLKQERLCTVAEKSVE